MGPNQDITSAIDSADDKLAMLILYCILPSSSSSSFIVQHLQAYMYQHLIPLPF